MDDDLGKCERLFREVGNQLDWFKYRPQDLLVKLAAQIREEQCRSRSEELTACLDDDRAVLAMADPPPTDTRRTTVSRVRHNVHNADLADSMASMQLKSNTPDTDNSTSNASTISAKNPGPDSDPAKVKKKKATKTIPAEKPFSFFPTPQPATATALTTSQQSVDLGGGDSTIPNVPGVLSASPPGKAKRTQLDGSPELLTANVTQHNTKQSSPSPTDLPYPSKQLFGSATDTTASNTSQSASTHEARNGIGSESIISDDHNDAECPDQDDDVVLSPSPLPASPEVQQSVDEQTTAAGKWSRIQALDDSDAGDVELCTSALDDMDLNPTAVDITMPAPPPRHRARHQIVDSSCENSPVVIERKPRRDLSDQLRRPEQNTRGHFIVSSSESSDAEDIPNTTGQAEGMGVAAIVDVSDNSAKVDSDSACVEVNVANDPPQCLSAGRNSLSPGHLSDCKEPSHGETEAAHSTLQVSEHLPGARAVADFSLSLCDDSGSDGDVEEEGKCMDKSLPYADSPSGVPAVAASWHADEAVAVSADGSMAGFLDDQAMEHNGSLESDDEGNDDYDYGDSFINDDDGDEEEEEDDGEEDSNGGDNDNVVGSDVENGGVESASDMDATHDYGVCDDATGNADDATGNADESLLICVSDDEQCAAVSTPSHEDSPTDGVVAATSSASLGYDVSAVLDSPRIDFIHHDGSLSFVLPSSAGSTHHRSRLLPSSSRLQHTPAGTTEESDDSALVNLCMDMEKELLAAEVQQNGIDGCEGIDEMPCTQDYVGDDRAKDSLHLPGTSSLYGIDGSSPSLPAVAATATVPLNQTAASTGAGGMAGSHPDRAHPAAGSGPSPRCQPRGSTARRSVILVSDNDSDSGSESNVLHMSKKPLHPAARVDSSSDDDFENFLVESKTPRASRQPASHNELEDFIVADDDCGDFLAGGSSDEEEDHVADEPGQSSSIPFSTPRPRWEMSTPWKTPAGSDMFTPWKTSAAGSDDRENDVPDDWQVPPSTKGGHRPPGLSNVDIVRTPKRLPASTPVPASAAAFKRSRVSLCQRYFQLFNHSVFSNKLPADMRITWNNRMRTTSGFCYTKRSSAGEFTAWIELADKVCDSEERLRDTLLHEMCHAAVWLIDRIRGGHGPAFKAWARIALRAHPNIPAVSRCHNYSIATKYSYKCTGCGFVIGRHSKSINTEKQVCPYCLSTLELQSGASGKQASGFALFVKENFKSVKSSMLQGSSHGDIMAELGVRYRQSNAAAQGNINDNAAVCAS
ncbi:uncharacterized protein LOC135819353 [Sycon ciliatum]|uniref:uncharacterized protein LOC135819353 n=1 Tax=Sycon ciliatum TaxID=27933 RepID=UPI0031F70188